MRNTLKTLFTPPDLANTQHKLKAFIAYASLLSSLVSTIIFLLLYPHGSYVFIGLLTLVFILGCMFLLRKGHVMPVARAYVIVLYIFFTGFMLVSDHFIQPIWAVSIVTAAGVLLTMRDLLLVTVFVCVSTVLVDIHSFGQLGEATALTLPLVILVSASLILAQLQSHILYKKMMDYANRIKTAYAERNLAENRYEVILKSIPMSTTIIDSATYRVVYANDKARSLLGKIGFDVDTQTLNDLIDNHLPPEEHTIAHTRMRTLTTEDGEMPLVDYTLMPKNRLAPTYVQVKSRPIEHEGRPSILIIMIEVTETKVAQKALEIRELEYRNLVETQAEMICRFNPITMEMTYVNPAYLRYFNLTTDQVIGKSFVKLIALEFQKPVREAIKTVMETGQTQSIEQLSQKPNGEQRWQVWTNVPILDEDNNIIGIQAVGRDIHERKIAEEAVRQSEENYRTILEQVPLGVVVHSVNTLEVQYANSSWEKMIGGKEFEAYAGLIPVNCVPPDQIDIYEEYINDLLHNGQLRNARMDILRLDNTRLTVEMSALITVYHGEASILTLIQDISTRLKALELESELENERSLAAMRHNFISMMSHEFRTPLTIIKSSADIMNMYGNNLTPDQFKRHTDKINAQIKHTISLLDDILLLNKANAGMLEYNPSWQNIIPICQEIIKEAQETFEHSHPIEIELPPKAIIMPVDERLIRHIMSNLLGNAAKYSPPDAHISVTITTNDTDNSVEVCVRDQGIGIPSDYQKRMFEPFTRAKNVDQVSGTGLGLAIVKTSVDLHGGAITVDSSENEGTAFTFSLPLP